MQTAREFIGRLAARAGRAAPLPVIAVAAEATAAEQPVPEPGPLVLEHFHGPQNLRSIRLPVGSWSAAVTPGDALQVIVTCTGTGLTRRGLILHDAVLAAQAVDVSFPAFSNPDGALFALVLSRVPLPQPLSEDTDAAASPRPPITLECNAAAPFNGAPAAMAAVAVMSRERVSYAIEQAWCDQAGVFLSGWVHAFGERVLALRIVTNLAQYDIRTFAPRPDLVTALGGMPGVLDSGFGAYLPWQAGSRIRFEVTTAQGTCSEDVLIPRPPAAEALTTAYCLTDGSTDRPKPPPAADDDPLLMFMGLVNRPGLSVMEAGARAVSENGSLMRHAFHGGATYRGMDIHPGPNVDIVGDAHRLHELVGEGTLDATFSFSLMEHLAYPWLYAQSVNRALRIGGIAFQSTHQTCGLHEVPNDFWRFSDNGLQVLFGPEMGFEVIAAGMRNRMRIHPAFVRAEEALAPLLSAWAQSFILVRKVADLGPGAVAWPVGAGSSADLAQNYPQGSSVARYRESGGLF